MFFTSSMLITEAKGSQGIHVKELEFENFPGYISLFWNKLEQGPRLKIIKQFMEELFTVMLTSMFQFPTYF